MYYLCIGDTYADVMHMDMFCICHSLCFSPQIRFLAETDLPIVTLLHSPGQHNMCHLFSCVFFYILCFAGVIVNGGFRPETAL